MSQAALLLALAAAANAAGPAPDALPEASRRAAELVRTAAIPQVGVPDADREGDDFRPEDDEPLPNFGRVGPGLLRSGQPSAEGLRLAAAMGARSVLSLRMGVSDEEREAAGRLGLGLRNVRMNGILAPSFTQVDRALAAIEAGPAATLVHCRHGKDRTGLVLAAWRVVKEGWEIERAAAEAEAFGCCHRLFPDPRDYLFDYLEHRAGREPVLRYPVEPDPDKE